MQPGLPFDRPRIDLYYVRSRRARRYLLRLDADGRARVTIPRGGSRREASLFAARHAEWLAREYARMAQVPPAAADEEALRRRAQIELPARLHLIAERLGLAVTRVTIRDQRTRWGSCARDGRISLNWRLIRMPDWVRDYVIIHELMHLRRLDHSPAYWALVAETCPDYAAARGWLRLYGRGL